LLKAYQKFFDKEAEATFHTFPQVICAKGPQAIMEAGVQFYGSLKSFNFDAIEVYETGSTLIIRHLFKGKTADGGEFSAPSVSVVVFAGSLVRQQHIYADITSLSGFLNTPKKEL